MYEKDDFETYLRSSGHSDKSITSRVKLLNNIESKTGESIDSIVKDDKKTLKVLKEMSLLDHKGNMQNALRHYYTFYNKKSFPTFSSITSIDNKMVEKVLQSLVHDYECFVSEAQLRDAFAIELLRLSKDQYIVMPEYSIVNYTSLPEKILHFDLVCINRITGEKVLFEFKYKTKKMYYQSDYMAISLSNQSDTTYGRYYIWRDIYRIQEVINSKKYIDLEIKKGFVIFISNNETYKANPSIKSQSFEFSIAPGLHPKAIKKWPIGFSAKSDCKGSLEIKKDYNFNYSQYSTITAESGEKVIFEQLIVEI